MNEPIIQHTVIEKSNAESPRNDTANILELSPKKLMCVWHKFSKSPEGGSDFGISRIYSRSSYDGGITWVEPRLIIDLEPDDINVQAPALCALPNGDILLVYLRAHGKSSTSLCLSRSYDGGETFEFVNYIWRKSSGQLLQGGASSLLRLSSRRLLYVFHGGTGEQGSQHNSVRSLYSDDDGASWTMSTNRLDLPMRGAMEASACELGDGRLVMSLRTQLGSVFISYSEDGGENWSLAQTSGLKSPESCTCLRRIPGTDNLVLFWNDSVYIPDHHHYGFRTPLSAALSNDGGLSWKKLGDIDTGDYEFTNLGCTFLTNGNAVVTYMKVQDKGLVNGEFKPGNYPPFWRDGMDLVAAVINKEFFNC